MMIELSKLEKLLVGSFDSGRLIGSVRRVIIDKEEARAIGFLVKQSGFFSKTKVASIQDVVDIDQAGLVLRSAESFVDTKEVVRIEEIIESNFNLIGLKAINKEKRNLGKVYDALIDSNTGDIMRIYVKQIFQDYVFERSQIEEITLRTIKLKTEKFHKSKSKVESLAQAKIA